MSSKIPSELLVPRGLNGLIDTYPDLNYGLGVLEHRHLVDSGEQMSGLPDGLQKESDLLLGDLSDFMGEEQHSDMLFIDVEPDAEIQALPEFQEPVAELESAWEKMEDVGVYADFQKELIAPVQSVSPEISEELLEETLYKAARAYANELSQNEIDRLVKSSLEEMTYRLQDELEWLKSQRGLNGKVYVLASAYPNLHNGQWKDEVRKLARTARYLIVDTDTVMGRKLASQDRFMGMQVVEEINWKEAYAHYAPKLKALGCRLASEGSYEQRIQQGFLNIPKKQANLGTRPQDFRPTDHITLKEAREQFERTDKAERKVYARNEREQKMLFKQAAKKAVQSYRAGLISKSELKEIVSTRDHNKVLAALSEKKRLTASSGDYELPAMTEHRTNISREREYQRVADEVAKRKAQREDALSNHSFSETSEYQGVQQTAHYTNYSQGSSVDKAQERIQQRQAKKHQEQVEQKVQKIASAITRGLRGESLQKMIKSSFNREDLRIASPMLNPILKETNALAQPQVKKAREYQGTIEHQHQASVRNDHQKKISQQERTFQKVARWTRQQMTEGTAGSVLTGLLKTKFAPSFLKQAQQVIDQVRAAHEGLSGFAYVDAEAYASPTGSKGCDEGALKHRANQLKFVLAMDRCQSCSFANRLADGTPICQKYNKKLASEIPVENPSEYQAEMLRMADASDAEQTASLFGTTYTNDFGLQNSSLDGFGFNETASVEQLSGLFFGGMDIGDEE